MKLKKLLAFVVALAMVMGIVPTMSIAAFADDSQVAEVDGTVYSSLAEAVTAAVDAYMDEPIAVTLLADTDQNFTLEFGVIELVTDGYNYTGTATVTGALLIADCELENVVCTAKATNSDKTKFGYTSLEPGTEMVNGAQVRIGKGADAEGKVVGEESGLRFITTVDRMDTLAGIAYEHYDAGTSTYDEGYQIGAKIMAEGSNEEVTIPATLWQTEGEVFTTALTNLAEKNYNRRYTASAYVEVEGIRFEDDSYATRSIYQVAAGLLAGSDAKETNEMSQTLVNVLNAYVNQTGVRLTLSDSSTGATLEARTGSKNGAYTGEAFFTVGNTVYRNGMYKVTLKSVGKSVINTEIFNEYVRINNNNTAISRVTGITDNGDGTYTVTFDYADMDNGSGVINEPVTLANGNITAYIPAGVSFTGSADKLKLVLKSIDDENSEVEAEDGEELDSFDIHVNGVMEGNTTPIIITLTEVAEKGLNRGNLKLYHVEDGVQVEMEQVDSVEELTKHNQFTYEPLDGTIVVALASFSEVALVAEEDKAWKGNYDYSWYAADATELTIANADQLAAFGAIVGGMAEGIAQDSFKDKTVKLTSDINLGDKESENNENLIFYPIGYYNSTGSYEKVSGGSVTSDVNSFEGTFDGNGHTISNFYQNTWEMFGDYNSGYSDTPNHYKDAMGLFGYVVGGTIKNLTVDNFSSDGEFTPTGVIAAYAVNSTFENIALTNCNPRVYNTGNGGIVGIGGNSEDPDTYKLTFENITIDNTNKITALWGSWDVACGGLVGMFRGAGHAYMTNCHVAAQIDVYNDVCGNYQYYWYRYAGMMIGTNKNMITDDNGYTVPETEKFHAENCTVHFGEWNDYYYCELVANSLASYTHDHQFSRLERVQKVEGTTITYLDGTTGTVPESGRFNYVVETVEGKPSTVNASCYHFVDGAVWNHADAGKETVDGVEVLKEDKQHVYLPFNQLFTGYGWGVKHVPVYNGEDYAFEGITILDREEADSVKKFEKATTALDSYTTGTTVTIGELFEATSAGNSVGIVNANVQVFVSPVGEESTAGGAYVAGTTNWTNGTLTFSGIGAATITITDYYYCTPTTITVTVEDYPSVDKFKAKENLNFKHTVEGGTIEKTLGDIFEAVSNVTIDDANVTVTVDNEEVCTYVKNESDWTKNTLTFKGTGTVTLAITDNDYCNTATATVTITEPDNKDKFALVFENTDEYLYRVGNDSTTPVALSSLFKTATDVTDDEIGTVQITVKNVAGTAGGTYTAGTNWIKGKIQFSGTGVVKVTIDDNMYANELSLYLEVVDAKNATTAVSATSSNVVLLNNVSGGFSVSGGYTLFGNGFKVTLPTTVQSDYSSGYVGYVYLTGGNLDNVRIEGPVYPEMYIYRDQAKDSTDTTKVNYFYNSVLINGGNCTISNSYISGSRTALCIRGGNNVVMENTTLAGGAYANMHIAGASTVTLRDLTTVQTDVTDSYGKGKTAHGLGIAVESAVVDLYIEGELNQYNWLCKEQWNSIVPSNYQSTFPDFFGNDKFELYWHYLDNETDPYVNMAFIYACNWDTSKIHDNRTSVDYATCDATIAGVAGGVYSNASTGGNKTITKLDLDDPGYTSPGFNPVAPKFDFDNTANNDADDENDAADAYCVYDEASGTLKIGVAGDSETIDLSGVAVTKSGEALAYTAYLNGTQISGNNVTIKASDGTKQTLTFNVTDDAGYDKDGNPIEGSIDYIWTITVEMAVLAYPAPVWNMGGDYTFDTSNCYYAYYQTSQGYGEAVPIFEGIKVNYYNKSGTLVECDLLGTTTLPTGSNNANANAFTYTLSDGSTLTMKFVSGWKSGATTHQFTAYNSKAYVYPQSLDNDNYVRAKTTNQDFNVKISYTFTDPNGQSTETVTMNWYNAAASNGSVSTVQWKTFDSTNGKEPECITPETLITLADGSQVEVQNLKGDEELLVWNLETGKYDTAPIVFIDVDGEKECEIIHLYFEDETDVEVIYEHGFFDVTCGEYVYLDKNTSEEHIGHSFVMQDDIANNTWKTVELTAVVIENRVTRAYSPVTFEHLCYYTDGMLSMPGGIEGLFNIFEVDTSIMAYDAEKMAQDIETYGLYTYEDFEDIIPESAYEAYNGDILKVAIGKDMLTWERIYELAERYVK